MRERGREGAKERSGRGERKSREYDREKNIENKNGRREKLERQKEGASRERKEHRVRLTF